MWSWRRLAFPLEFSILALCAAPLAGCDVIYGSNPSNCVKNPESCARDSFCNLETQRCETLDCSMNVALCTTSEYCEPATQRCAPKNCVIEPTLCSLAQECDALTRQCRTRTFVLGQPDSATHLNTAYGMQGPWSALLVTNPLDATRSRLVVADSANQRVLIWNDVPTQNRPADAVLGMPDIHTQSVSAGYGGVSELSMRQPWSMTSNGTRLVVGDYSWNRLLIYNQIPSVQPVPGPPQANILWGQTSFEQIEANAGQPTVHSLGASAPYVFFDRPVGTAFFIADHLNNRVLGFIGIPTGSGQAPTVVLGQSSFTASAGATAADKLMLPRGVATNTIYLLVADSGNHRVVAYARGLTMGESAVSVLGQADFTSGQVNRGGAVGASTLNNPAGIWEVNDGSSRLFIADQYNHRVLRFTLPNVVSPPPVNADLVLGQASYTANLENRNGPPDAGTMSFPTHVNSDGRRLVVSDFGNHRVLIWNQLTTLTSGQAADVVLGQPNATTRSANTPPAPGALQFQGPEDVATDGQVLAVADSANHRVLLWLQLPQSGAAPPDVVLGQPSFTSARPNNGQSAPDAFVLNKPRGVAIADGRLAVADAENHRVLIWNQIPTQSFAPADIVLGQSGFSTSVANKGAAALNRPVGVRFGSGNLYVADAGNNRVVRFDSPSASGGAATLVLGQPNLDTAGANTGGLSARSFTYPLAILIDGGRLLVSDYSNQRVLIWNSLPTQNNQAASVVLGQADFTSQYTRPDRSRLLQPAGMAIRNGRLYVASQLHNRILYWNEIPSTNGARADGVLGQTDFLSTQPNNQELQPIERLSAPEGLAIAADQLFIADAYNDRLVVRDLPK